MHDTLTVEIHNRLSGVDPVEWKRLFAASPDPVELVQLVERSGFDRFCHHCIVVKDGRKPILVIPLFLTTYPLSDALKGGLARVVERVCRCFPNGLSMRLLGVGMVEGEWGEIGVDAEVDRDLLADAWDMALEALDGLADGVGARMVVWVNFTEASGRMIPLGKLAAYSSIQGISCHTVPVVHASIDDYLASLSRATRKDLRRKLRAAEQVEILRPPDPSPWMDRIHSLYYRSLHTAEHVFGEHRPAFFSEVAREVPGARYVLYVVNGELAAFNLVVRQGDRLIDKYLCMDPDLGREYSLYFVSWIANLSDCIAQGIKVYHAGPGADIVKAHLRAESIPSEILFRHRNRIVHRLLTWMRRWGGYAPAGTSARATLGREWA